MYFKKETIKKSKKSDINIRIEKCQHYTLFDKEQTVRHFYCDIRNAFGNTRDNFIAIRSSKGSIFKKKIDFVNVQNNSIVGQLTISNFVAFKSLKTTFNIIHKEPYEWKVDKSEKGFSLFTSTTFSAFCGRLFNDKEKLTVKWNYKSYRVIKHKLEELPVYGELEFENSKNYISFVCRTFSC